MVASRGECSSASAGDHGEVPEDGRAHRDLRAEIHQDDEDAQLTARLSAALSPCPRPYGDRTEPLVPGEREREKEKEPKRKG